MTRRERQDLDDWHQSERATFTDDETDEADRRQGDDLLSGWRSLVAFLAHPLKGAQR